jgi:hypothetical protein
MSEPKVHTLASGATLISTSPGHEMRFSDGTTAEPQYKDVCDALTCRRVERTVGEIKGMTLVELRMVLGPEQLAYLHTLCRQADIVLIPFPVLTALREQGQRDYYPNAVAGNSTAETQRSAPADKIWDINRWSY